MSFSTRINADPEICVEPMVDPAQWIFSIIEVVLSVAGVILNTIITVISHSSVPMPHSQRKLIASISINFALLSGFQFARNLFLFLIIEKPCLNHITTISCKLQDFPLLFCYIHCAMASFLLGFQTNFEKINPKDKQPIVWYSSCSVWQSAVAAICITITLIFTAFDRDTNNSAMSRLTNISVKNNEDLNRVQSLSEEEQTCILQCSILLAVTRSMLIYGLLTLLIVLHLLAYIFISISSHRQNNKKSWIAFTILSIKEVMKYETLAWQISLFISGCVVLYRHILRDSCEECSLIILEIFFIIIPLIISFLNPLYLIWYVLPVRDAATKTFPIIKIVLPEYTLVPPQVPTASSSTTFPLQSPRTDTTASSDQLDIDSNPCSSKSQTSPIAIIDE